MIRIVLTVLFVQAGICLAALHWSNGRASLSFNNTHADEKRKVVAQRYIQTVQEGGTFLFGYREERLRAHHQKLKLPAWSGSFKSTSGAAAVAPATRSYRFGIAVTAQNKPYQEGFKSTYVFVRIWLLELSVLAAGGILWSDKWFIPLARHLRRPKKKIAEP